MKPVAAALAIVVAALAPAAADTSNVHVIASVTDRQGRPVSGLGAKDFQIKEDGQVQTVVSVEPRRAAARRLAILLDEFHVDAADTERVRTDVSRFLREQLRPEDTAVVVKPLDPLSKISLGADRASLESGIAAFEGRRGIYEPRTPLEEETLGRAPDLVEAGRAQIVLSALRALTARLGNVPGQSAILLVSDGFNAQPRRSLTRGLPDEGIVGRFANRYDVPVYVFDPRDRDPDEPNALARLATDTGGTMANGVDLAGNMARAVRDLDGGYILTFAPSHADDGRFHPISVALERRPLAEVRVRAGYVSALSPEMRRALNPDPAPELPTRMLRRSPLIDVWSGVTRASAANGHVVVAWAPGANTAAASASRVALKATTKDGRLLFEGFLSPARSGAADGASTRAEFDAPLGAVQIDMTILSLDGRKVDTDARDLEIAAPRGGVPMLLPPVIIATDSARGFREASTDADATPDPSRVFRRTERLLIRVPAFSADAPVQVSVRLLNRIGQVMRTLDVMPPSGGLAQFDLPLATLAPGDYFFQISASAGGKTTDQRLSFHVGG